MLAVGRHLEPDAPPLRDGRELRVRLSNSTLNMAQQGLFRRIHIRAWGGYVHYLEVLARLFRVTTWRLEFNERHGYGGDIYATRPRPHLSGAEHPTAATR